jgi:RimJ/RimL family protein N-acetyltransferase
MILEGLLVDLVPDNRAFRERHHEWANNESSFWGSGGDRDIVSRAQFEAQRQHWVEARAEGRSNYLGFGIQAKDGTPLGTIGLREFVPHSRLAVLGAQIGEPDYWGGGYGTDALLLIVDYGFDWLDLRRVWLGTSSMNARVQRQMQKVVFKLEARLRDGLYADGVRYDDLLYGLLRDEWPGREAMIEKSGLQAR